MAIPKRNSSPANATSIPRTFFVTTSTAARRRFFQVDAHCELLISVLYEYRKTAGYLLHEFCIMPDHVHLLLTVPNDMSIEKAVQLIKGGFAFRAGRELSAKPPIWQRGFSEERVMSLEKYDAHRRYIRENPIRAALAASAADFRFCSAYPGYDMDPPPLYLSG